MELVELAGAFVFAVSGVFAAAERRVDWFGAMVLGVVTAIGGGTLRGLVLGATPVFWIDDEPHLIAALAGAIAAIAAVHALGSVSARRAERLLELADAAGLALFCVLGASVTLDLGFDGLVAAVMGVVTAVGGGVVRDILAAREPLVLRGQIYATAALAGATAYVCLVELTPAPEAVASVVGMGTALGLRLLGMYREWSLPVLYRS